MSFNLKRLRERSWLKFGPPAVDRLVRLSTWSARQKLKRSPLRILVDNSLLGFAITHETAWISTGPKKWGPHEVNTGYAARVPVHAAGTDSQEHKNIEYLPGIADLAMTGAVVLLTSAELANERFRQPAGRFQGYGWFDYNLFCRVNLASVDGHKLPTIGPEWMGIPSAEEQQYSRLSQSDDALYASLVRTLGEKHSLDAWHIRTAEVFGLFCFLTMDFKLRRHFEANSRHEPIRSLNTRVMTPIEFGREFGLFPIPPRLFSYHDLKFFTRPDLSMPGNRRRPLSSYKKR